ncbi:zinc finger CCCH domain-containing protein 23-like [Silene latifolia]|uniref:zinc finger CCCH domain-containing protein 23-like n=1 Tax=Silene latifolia TaxID=37657 RepID=UPI003D76DD9D
MMIGENPWQESLNPTVEIQSPTWSPPQSNGGCHSPTYYDAVLSSLRRYLMSPGGEQGCLSPSSPDFSDDAGFPLAGEYDDEFFIYDFKVKKCTRARAHDWTECPFAHPGEKARRRDPRKYSYAGTACADFRRGHCRKGDGCEFAHGVFECWLHPSRFRTQVCKDGLGCKRRVCFFAHSPDQLRAGGSGLTSPISPYSGSSYSEDGPEYGLAEYGPGIRSGSVAELAASLRSLQFNKVKSMPNSWVGGSPILGSPRGGGVGLGSPVSRTGFFSLPTTPTRPRVGFWDSKECVEEEPVMERVESGRELRTRMFEKLSKENPLSGPGSNLGHEGTGPGPDLDLGWVSDLIE